jgi:hypothetical protein
MLDRACWTLTVAAVLQDKYDDRPTSLTLSLSMSPVRELGLRPTPGTKVRVTTKRLKQLVALEGTIEGDILEWLETKDKERREKRWTDLFVEAKYTQYHYGACTANNLGEERTWEVALIILCFQSFYKDQTHHEAMCKEPKYTFQSVSSIRRALRTTHYATVDVSDISTHYVKQRFAGPAMNLTKSMRNASCSYPE